MLKFEKGVFTSPGSTGNQTVSLIDSAFGTVKALLVWATYETAEADVDGDAIFCEGLGTYRGGSVQQHVVAHFADDAVGTSVTAKCSRSDFILRGYSAGVTPTVDFAATLNSLGDAQFVINWSDLPGTSSIKIHYVALGGAEITDAVVLTVQAGTGTFPYSQDVTVAAGFGYPDLLVAIAADEFTGTDADSASSAQLTFGVGKNDIEQGSTAYVNEDAAATMQLGVIQNSTFLNVMALDNFSRMEAALAARSSWPQDGFRINHFIADAQGAGRAGVLALRGSFTAVIGSGTVPTAAPTVTQNLPVGATPRGAIFFHNVLPVTAVLNNSHADLGLFGLGATDGTREGWSGVGDDDGNTTAITHRHHSESKVIKMFTPSASGTLTSAADASFSGEDVVLSWADTDTVEREYRYLLLGDAPTDSAAYPAAYARSDAVHRRSRW